MTAATDIFVERARAVPIEAAAPLLGLKLSGKRHEHPQPCPVCGGTDTFSFNTKKNKWNCRHGGVGGQDAIGMAAHVLDLDLRQRATFLEACAAVTGEPMPEEAEREDPAERAARLARLDELRRRHRDETAARQASHVDFRARERDKARGIVDAAAPLATIGDECEGDRYLALRGCGAPGGRWLRFAPALTYWHGQDGQGRMRELHCGPALVVPFIDPSGTVIGCHLTWIDIGEPPKFRPVLFDPDTGAVLPTKKMRGTKKGGVLPLLGDPASRRWLGAEGIENTLAFARWEGFRADTFYFAAGDLGNMAGPADPKSRFPHPELTRPDKNGVQRKVMVPGPVPAMREDGEVEAMVVPDHVDEFVLLADGDSERVMTAAAMVRAKARHARPGRLIPVVWPRAGTDFAAMLAGADLEDAV